MPSNLLLPVVPGVKVPTALPPCPGLRGEPCRTYQAYANRSVKVPNGAKGRPAHKHAKHRPKKNPRH